ncbi:hypothetical protein [Pararhodospirillum photometricum]|uniref:Uncharacterized protein n=1 Tax=Pararhodospirillum photometricum DSM 122 TaxID=1150469 RepID=H6SJA3_PARPM|nr:hypothetical protein [Pararhodospirillum photometricum]CCG08068.1 Putative uncharacterized protein [Pararhodospirillum photometricum DSM 122]
MAEFSDGRIRHLAMIQEVIARMAGESARMKQFALTAIGVLASTCVATRSAPLAGVAGVLTVIFWLLDAQYLRQERWFRALYDQVRLAEGPTDFLMTPNAEIRRRHTLLDGLFGWSVAPLYGALLTIAVLLARFVGSAPGTS